MSPGADALFGQFQENGSPLALAQVFDQLAPQLLLLAGHLVHEAAAAEDLVQSTFLDAIEVAPRFDPQRGTVQRWLVGILVNNARKELRRRSRSLDPARLGPEPAAHPEAEAAAHEFLQTVERALAELPPHYREVLRLGLLHGLDQAEIATSLERPRETVKTQFRRGVEQLRAMLPKGFALSVALAFTMGRGMAAVRRAVLGRAETLLAGAGQAALPAKAAGGAGARMTVLAVASLAVLAVLVPAVSWFAARDRGGLSPSAQPVATLQPPAEAPPVPSARTPAPADQGVAPGAQGGTLQLAVRFRRDGSPAAGVVVRARPEGDRDWLREIELRCDQEGRAVLATPVPGPWQVVADRGGAVRVDLLPRSDVAATLDIPPGVEVRGTVVDPADSPLADAEVWLAQGADGYADCILSTRTDTEGRFTLRDVAPGRFVGVLHADWAQARVKVVQDQGGVCDLRFALWTRSTPVPGVVREPDGAPAAFAVVLAASTIGDPIHAHAQLPRRLACDGQGRFQLLGVPREAAVYLTARSAHGVTGLLAQDVTTPRTPLVVPLVHGTTVHGSVTDAAGAPAAGATVTATFMPETTLPEGTLPDTLWIRSVAVGTDGRFALEHVAPGSTALLARHETLGAMREQVRLPDGEALLWQPRLAHTGDVRCLVADEHGAPLQNWSVVLSQPGKGIAATATSNGQGKCVFRGVERTEYVLSVTDPESLVPQLTAVVLSVWPGDDVHRLVVRDARRARSWLRFRARAPDGRWFVPAAYLLHRDGADMVSGKFPVQEDQGQCRVGPLPAGECQWLLGSAELGFRGFLRTLAPGVDVELGEVVFQPPATIEVLVPSAQGSNEESDIGILVESGAPYMSQVLEAVSGRALLHAQPGSCVLQCWTPTLPPQRKPLTVTPGGRISVVLETPSVVQRHYTYCLPTHGERVSVVELTLRSAGVVLFDAPLVMPGWNHQQGAVVALVPGAYEVELRDPLRGRTQRTRFVVTAEPQGPPVFQVGPF